MKKNKLVILTSQNSKYQGQIDKIINQSPFSIERKYIEDNYDYQNDIVYSFVKLNNVNELVINYKFYLNYKDKKEVQNILSNKINTPSILSKVNTFAYLKENKHEGVVKLINSIDNIDLTNYYLEEVVKGEESKYYYVFDLLFNSNSKIIDKDLNNIANVIATSLNLDVFSFDVIKKDNINYVIDVNISPGFYKSDVARTYFISYIERNYLWQV